MNGIVSAQHLYHIPFPYHTQPPNELEIFQDKKLSRGKSLEKQYKQGEKVLMKFPLIAKEKQNGTHFSEKSLPLKNPPREQGEN